MHVTAICQGCSGVDSATSVKYIENFSYAPRNTKPPKLIHKTLGTTPANRLHNSKRNQSIHACSKILVHCLHTNYLYQYALWPCANRCIEGFVCFLCFIYHKPRILVVININAKELCKFVTDDFQFRQHEGHLLHFHHGWHSTGNTCTIVNNARVLLWRCSVTGLTLAHLPWPISLSVGVGNYQWPPVHVSEKGHTRQNENMRQNCIQETFSKTEEPNKLHHTNFTMNITAPGYTGI